MRNIFLMCAILLMMISCEKGPGEGGTSTIRGKIMTYDLLHNDVVNRLDTVDNDGDGDKTDGYYTADYDVFIIYGSLESLHDDIYKTSYDGSFHFQYLREGIYTIFIYSECEKDTTGLADLYAADYDYANALENTIWNTSCVDGNYAEKVQVNISDSDQEINLGDLIIYNIVNP
jgi:hypothetical protein